MIEKLTPLSAHLTRRGVPVFLANSRTHTQEPERVLVLARGIAVDLGVLRLIGGMADVRAGTIPIRATPGRFAGTAQSLSISRVMRESSRMLSRDG